VNSELGKGTVFTLTLPIDPVLDIDADTEPAGCRLTASPSGAVLHCRAGLPGTVFPGLNKRKS
jgi:hypothetical protein